MVIEVKNITYKGIYCEHVDSGGWKIVLAEYEYLFPTLQDAQRAIEEFHREVIPKYKGKKYRKKAGA